VAEDRPETAAGDERADDVEEDGNVESALASARYTRSTPTIAIAAAIPPTRNKRRRAP
jgi:hypothetical protein